VGGDQEGATGVVDAGSVGAEGGLGAEEVLNGPQLPPGADIVSAVEFEASEASDSHSSAWESETENGAETEAKMYIYCSTRKSSAEKQGAGAARSLSAAVLNTSRKRALRCIHVRP